MVPHVFHEELRFLVVGVKEAICMPVKIKRFHPVPATQFDVEGRGRFDPSSLKQELGVTVKNEHVRSHELPQLPGRQVIAHIGKPDSRRDPAGTAKRAEQCRLADAEGPAGVQHAARAVVLRLVKRQIRVIPDPIPNNVIEPDGLGHGIICCSPDGIGCMRAHRRVVRIDDRCRLQICFKLVFHNAFTAALPWFHGRGGHSFKKEPIIRRYRIPVSHQGPP